MKKLGGMIELVLALILFLVLWIYSLQLVGNHCSALEEHQIILKQEYVADPKNGAGNREQNKNTPQNEPYIVVAPKATTITINAPSVKQESTSDRQKSPQAHKIKWIDGLVCEAKAGEWLIALLTGWLVIATVWVAYFTRNLVDATVALVNHEAPRVVFNGSALSQVGRQQTRQSKDDDFWTEVIDVEAKFVNCGKSPAVMLRLNVKIIPLADDPENAEALYIFSDDQSLFLNYNMLPNEEGKHNIGCSVGRRENIPEEFLLVKEIVYEDVAGVEHITRECSVINSLAMRTRRHRGRDYNKYT